MEVAASFCMHRSWVYKCLAAVRGVGKCIWALRSPKGAARPRNLSRSQERQVFRWAINKRPDIGVEYCHVDLPDLQRGVATAFWH